ncbi:hypothetical protein V8F33_006291 [Rhypophila sp. PSN 637]
MDYANANQGSRVVRNEPIAVIGTGCRFPGDANTLSKFWDLLRQPRDVLRSVAERFNPEGWHHENGKYHGHSNVRSSYLLEGDQHHRFDAQFFGINAVEAQTLDPQVRLLLETVYEALESAGLTIEGLRGSDTAVYTGMIIGTYHISGVSAAMMSNRLSYFFDWHGPSITIDTACSSSLIAVHQAVQQLRAGHSRIAIAAGSNLLLDPADYVSMSKLDMLSPTGRSRMWDKEADGYARGEGVAAVVLKTLSAAEADDDHIECIIRETATNQDGRTPGITMPSAAAQAQLIRDCYARAGLDPTNAKQRPQYFEAHGTGTPAGDPVEAEAIQTAFFQYRSNVDGGEPALYVGGVKTVIGHSESAAGLAGLIKVSLALQHGTIPPSLLFNQINPRVESSYSGFLRLPTELTPWPDHDKGHLYGDNQEKNLSLCRRASVNSFGFGGSIAHAILESYTPSLSTLYTIKAQESASQQLAGHLPFVFSANSEMALNAGLASMLDYLKKQPEVNLRGLAMTLHSRRSRLPYSAAFSASTLSDLCHKLDSELHGNKNHHQHIKSSPSPSSTSHTSTQVAGCHNSNNNKKRILLIFTGQGAQCPRMGPSLIEQSPACAAIIDKLESRLATLDRASDRPSWSLKKELLKHPNDEQEGSDGQPSVAKAALSQPLCTALQILQVDLLCEALGTDLEITAAVGHSSGEIAAAYCAGVISAEDAICVAYYRGLAVPSYASDDTVESAGQALDEASRIEQIKGGMLAVGTGFQDAISLCNEPEFAGHDDATCRLEVAAVNSPHSVTLSGDEDAVEEAAAIFEDEGKPVTRLRVDNRAYHSRRMIPCSIGYLAALQNLDIQVNCSPQEQDSTIQRSCWVSSVGLGADVGNGFEMLLSGADVATGCAPGVLKDQYWVDNMVKPVMFMSAVQRAWELHGPFDMALEVGPHPALKRPTLDTIKAVAGIETVLPYTGLHVRGQDAVESFANALGYMWTYLGQGAPAASAAFNATNISSPLDMSRFDKFLSGNFSSLQPQFIVVKGLPPYSWDHKDKIYWHESRFTKALRLRSDPVHKLLGHLTPDSTAQDMRWRNILSLKEVPWLGGHSLKHQIVFPAAGYVVSALDAAVSMTRKRLGNTKLDDVLASIRLIEVLDLDIHNALTFDTEDTRIETITALTDISQARTDRIEANFKFNATPNYSGTDLTLLAGGRIRVTLGEFSDTILPRRDNHPSRLVPELSDIEADTFYKSLEKLEYQYTGPFRALSRLRRRLDFATGQISWEPSDSMLIHPGVLDSALQSVFLALCAPNSGGIWAMHVPKTIKAVQFNPHSSIIADVEVFTMPSERSDPSSQAMLLRVQGLETVPFSQPSPRDDTTMFSHVIWDVAAPEADLHVAVSYLSRLETSVPVDHRARLPSSPYYHYFKFASHTLSLADQGEMSVSRATLDAIGDNIVDIATGKTPTLDVAMRDGMLAEYYQTGSGFAQYTPYLARLVRQIVHRHGGSTFRILEVGPGTGSATRQVQEEIFGTYDVGFAEYTFTDISSGFFEGARAALLGNKDSERLKNVIFKVLDVRKDITGQGFVEGSYDLVIASAVLHATPKLSDTLTNVRRLLKPAGYLAVLEMPELDSVATLDTIFGAMPGWWLGADDGRALSPCVDLAHWDILLRFNGFSGCDTATSLPDCGTIIPMIVFVTQAVDDRVDFLRDPLSMPSSSLFPGNNHGDQKLLLLGGKTLQTSKFLAQITRILRGHWGDNIQTVRTLSEVSGLQAVLLDVVTKDRCVSSGQDSVFEHLPEENWTGLKTLLQQAATVLWVSTSRRSSNPHANMMIGLLRAAKVEIPTLDIQTLDIDSANTVDLDARDLAETLLRFKAATSWRRRGDQDSFLTTIEPELMQQSIYSTKESGPSIKTLLVPRVVTNMAMNDRFNSSRRSIRLPIPSSFEGPDNYQLEWPSNKHGSEGLDCTLRCVPMIHDRSVVHNDVGGLGQKPLRTTYSFGPAVRGTRNSSRYLLLGQDSDMKTQTIALTPKPTLFFVPLPELAVTVSDPAAEQAAFVTLVAYRLISVLFLDGLCSGQDVTSRFNKGSLVIYHPPENAFAEVIAEEAARLGHDRLQFVFITTMDHNSACPDNHPPQSHTGKWCAAHRMASDSALRSLLPHDTVALLDAHSPNADDTGDRIASCLRNFLPSHAYYQSVQSILSFPAAGVTHAEVSPSQLSKIASNLKTCVSNTLASLSKSQQAQGTVPAFHYNISPKLIYLDSCTESSRQSGHQLPGINNGNQHRITLDSVIAWSAKCPSTTTTPLSPPRNALSFTVQPADSLVTFSSSKAYCLAGLSGGLGLLLCEWMIRHGARHFVLSSRRAEDTMSRVWVDKMSAAYGAIVNIVSCDLADRAALWDLYHKRIKPTMPPVGGICQGAMVLDDVSIGDMTLENFLKVTRPKVQGSLNLDELFVARDEQLDFFIFFPSVGSMTGQPGQANYAAANMFMTALAEKRRRCGQVASVMHIGPILGAGYITRQGLDSALTLNNSTKSIMQGWFPITEKDFFQHFAEAILAGQRAHATYMKGESSSHSPYGVGLSTGLASVPIKAGLAEALERSEVADIIREALLLKLSVLFQAELDKLRAADPSSLSLSQMDVDSLMAVELRSWFVKSMQVNISVLKILSGASVAELVQIAVDTIPPALIPLVDQVEKATPAAKELQQPSARPSFGVQKNADGAYNASRDGPDAENGTTTDKAEDIISSVRSCPDLDTPVTPPDTTEGDPDRENVERQPLGAMNKFTSVEDPCSDCSCPEPDRLGATPKPQLERAIPLSYSQSLFWFSAAFSTHDPASLNMTAGFRLTGGALRVDKLQEAVMATGQQHESLRTCFFVDSTDGQPRQGIMESTALRLEHMQSIHDNYREENNVVGSRREQETGLDTFLLYHLDQVHHHVYDLERGRTVRLVLISHPSTPSEHYFIIGTHHLAMDGASFQPLMADILQSYNRLCGAYQGQNLELNTANALTQYPAFSQKQRDDFKSGDLNAELSFWREELIGKHGPCPPLPVLRNESFRTERPALQSVDDKKSQSNRYVHVKIGPTIKTKVQALCRRRRAATPFHFYLAVFRVLLWRFSGGHESFAIGIGDANRTEEEMMTCIGNFVNLLPIVFSSTANEHEADHGSSVRSPATDLNVGQEPEIEGDRLGSTTFTRLLDEVSSKTNRALANSKLPFQLLLDELGIPRSANTTPIFQAFADYRLARGHKTSWGAEHELELLTLRLSKLNYDVAIDILDNNSHGASAGDDRCDITFILRGDLYSQADAQRLANSYRILVTAFAEKPASLIGKADIFSQIEIDESLAMGQGPTAQEFPERTAVISERTVYRIITQLQRAGVSAGSRVAVLQEPTPDWVSSILAVMRMGAVYVPLDPTQPLARLSAMIQDIQPQVLLVDTETVEQAQKVLALERGKSKNTGLIAVRTEIQDSTDDCHLPSVTSPILAAPESAAAILYTSGSTGTPKGIVITHGGINSWLSPCDTLYHLTKPSTLVTLQQSAPGFDMSLMQVLTALCFGGAVYLLPRRLRCDGSAISSAMVRHAITLTFSTPSEVTSWIRHAPDRGTSLRSSSWKTALVGGEMLSRVVLDEFARLDKPDLSFHHMYGTTEATFCAAAVELDYRYLCKSNRKETTGITATKDTENSHEHHYPAGVALPNYKIYILDECQRPLPPGMQGEVYIAGAGVRRESQYLNNAALSQRTFLKDLFASNEDHARGWGYMQGTGDLGRWQSQQEQPTRRTPRGGVLIIEGRVEGDTMVKLRGLRVDLREVEVALLRAAAAVAALVHGPEEGTDLANPKDAVVSVRRRDSNSAEFLVAHVLAFTAGSSKPCQNLPSSFVRGLRHQLELLGLAPNLHPAFIIAVERLPMTSSGKLDRKAVAQMPLKENADRHGSGHDAGSSISWTSTDARLKTIWEDLLFSRLNHTSNTNPEPEMPHITPETDFFHIGGTSLSLLTLRERIKREFVGVEIPNVDLFDSSTLSDMARRIERVQQPVESARTITRAAHPPIDWEDEIRLRHSMLAADPTCTTVDMRLCSDRTQRLRGKVVILTGATGHLGSSLVHSLIADTSIAEVHCLAIRNPFARSDIDHLRRNPKVKLYPGDLGQPQMGLFPSPKLTTAPEAEPSALAQNTPEWIRALFGRADLIIHNGADTSYLKTYHSLKASNLTTTKDLIEWCLVAGSMISFHFVSTAGVGNLLFSSYPKDPHDTSTAKNEKGGQIDHTATQEKLTPSSLGTLTPPTDGSMGYTCSKWASERFLERLVERFPSLEVYVHRPTVISRGRDLIVSEEEDGAKPRGEKLRSTVPEFDGVHNIFWYARELNAVPMSTGIARGVLNVVRLEDVVEGILDTALVRSSRSNGANGDGGLRFVNHAGDLHLPLDEMRRWAAVRGREQDGSLYVQEQEPDGEGEDVDLSLADEFQEIPLEDWVHRACELGMHPTLAELLMSFARNGEVVFPTVVTK